MAKIYGLFGAMKGKVADVVMAVRNGEQIVRKYQPTVYNPSTEGQVSARARLKLMSQLSAVLAPIIAMPREGVVTARNMFLKKNYGLSSFSEGQATVTLAAVQLTNSVVGFPNIHATRGENNITVELNSASSVYDKVVYAAVAKQEDGALRMLGSAVVNGTGAASVYAGTLPDSSLEAVIYAYGVRLNTDAARAVFGDMQAITAETIAKLVVTRSVLESDVTLTETKGITLASV